MTTVDPTLDAPGRHGEIRAVPVRHPGRWAAAAVVVVVLGGIVYSVITTDAFHWDVVANNFFGPTIIDGVYKTLELTGSAMAIGIALGIGLAVMRLSANPLVSGTAYLYVFLFRGTPVLVQILFWNFISALYPLIIIGIPKGPVFYTFSANDVITPFVAGMLALGLNEGAYMAEIVRAGIQSVDHGQTEAAQALGMTRLATMRRIVLPQAMRLIVPPTGNETISMLKTSSLVSTIAIAELTYAGQIIYSRTFQQIPLLIVISLWYLVLTSVLTVIQYYVERRFARGAVRALPPTPLQRLRRMLIPSHAAPPGPPPPPATGISGASGEGR